VHAQAENLTILVVEDEWLLRLEIVSELQREGWTVLESSTAEDALNMIDEGQKIDLLITDIRLAGTLNGWDVAEGWRKVKAELPVIYTSGNTVNEARKVPGSVFLSKPCRISEIVEVSRKLSSAH
jgi:CheY-like chemotaxis protein